MMPTHARLAPSSAHRWMMCPGSIAMAEGIEETPSPYAAEGTAAHHLAESCLLGKVDPGKFRGAVIDAELRVFCHSGNPDGKRYFEVDDEMVDGVQLYLDVCREIIAEADDWECERRVELRGFAKDTFGTADLAAYKEANRRLTVVDLKYGKGVFVEVVENKQALTYALGLATLYHNRGVREIELVIVQPRLPNPVRRWLIRSDDLMAHAMELKEAAQRIHDGDRTLNPGPWCKFCRAMAICEAVKDSVVFGILEATEMDGEIFSMADPTKSTPEELAARLRSVPLVQSWCKAVEAFAHAEAMRGHMPPGFKFVAKKANRRWKDEKAAAFKLRREHGLTKADLFTVPEMRSPAQIEKLLARGERGVIAELSTKQSNGVSLALVDDPRPSVDPNQASGFEPVEIDGGTDGQ